MEVHPQKISTKKMSYTYNDFDHLADLSEQLDQFLANYDYDTEYKEPEAGLGPTLGGLTMAVVMTILSTLCLLFISICCVGFTRIIFVCKAISLLLYTTLHILDYSFPIEAVVDERDKDTGRILQQTPVLLWVKLSASLAFLHFNQLLSLLFLYKVFDCTCRTQIVEIDLMASVRWICLIASIILIASGVEMMLLAIFEKQKIQVGWSQGR